MEVEFNIFSLYWLVSVVLGFLVSLILLFFPRGSKGPNRWLGLAILGLTWGQVIGFLLESRLILEVPHVSRTGNLLALIYISAAYLYVRQVIAPRQVGLRDLIHLIPSLIFVIDYMPYFLSDADVKVPFLMADLESDPPVNRFNEGWLFPEDSQEWLSYIFALVYWMLEVRLLLKLQGNLLRFKAKRSRAWRWWLILFMFFQLLTFLPWLLGQLTGIDTSTLGLVHGSIFATVVMTALTLLFRPEILYGLKPGTVLQSNSRGNDHQSNPEVPVVDIKENIAALMEQQKVFLKHKYALANMAHDLGVPPHQLSHQLNSLLNTSFNDLINEYRVKHCLERIRNEKIERITLEAFALECGFNNRNSFTQAVKKITGKTPSALIREHRNGSLHQGEQNHG